MEQSTSLCAELTTQFLSQQKLLPYGDLTLKVGSMPSILINASLSPNYIIVCKINRPYLYASVFVVHQMLLDIVWLLLWGPVRTLPHQYGAVRPGGEEARLLAVVGERVHHTGLGSAQLCGCLLMLQAAYQIALATNKRHKNPNRQFILLLQIMTSLGGFWIKIHLGTYNIDSETHFNVTVEVPLLWRVDFGWQKLS